MKPEQDPVNISEFALQILETNKTAGAQVRDYELELVRDGGPMPVDLRTVPMDQWDAFIDYELTVPDVMTDILCAQPEGPLAEEVIWKLEELIERHHGIKEPYYASTGPYFQQHKKGWVYVPEAAPYLTGFTLGKEETKAESFARWSGNPS